MAKGAFTVGGDGSTITFGRNKSVKSVPEDQDRFFRSARALHAKILLILSHHPEKQQGYIEQLRSLARIALEGENADPELGTSNLNQLSNDILVQESQRIKLRYLLNLLKIAIAVSVICLLFILYAKNSPLAAILPASDIEMAKLHGYITLFAGSQIGAFLSFGTRRLEITSLEELADFNGSLHEPFTRLLYAGLISLAIGLILSLDLAVIKIGSFDAKSFLSGFEPALLVGLVIGFTERTLSMQLSTRIGNLMPRPK